MKLLTKFILAMAGVCLTGMAQASSILEIEANDSIATAQNLDGSISSGPSGLSDIGGLGAWVSVAGTGNDTYDYYSLSVAAGETWAFDIDNAYDFGFDLEMHLYDAGGTNLASNDDGLSPDPDGSTGSGGLGFDPFIEYTFAAAGTYTVGVCSFNCFGDPGGITGDTVETGMFYDLNISMANNPVATPEPGTLALIGLGLAGIGFMSRRRRT